jgi:predicted nucleic acid-binding protein
VARGDIQPAISWLSEVEMAAALQARLIRQRSGSISTQLEMSYRLFLEERSTGIFTLLPIGREVFDLARSLGERYGGVLGVRALDVLHVAAAANGGANAFATFDDRQAKLAHEVGLKLL